MDGTFNNQPLPSDDYWFTIKLEDGREARTFCFKTII
jgi:gliding motility-associated-like protein